MREEIAEVNEGAANRAVSAPPPVMSDVGREKRIKQAAAAMHAP